jgi:hypothetical protein
LIKVQNIIHAVFEKKRAVLDAFKDKVGDRNAVIEIVALHDTVSFFTSRKIEAKGGNFYLREKNAFSKDEEIPLLSYRTFFELCKDELNGLNLSKLNLSGLVFCGGNLNGTDLTDSDATGTDFTGAEQENMVINGTNLSKSVGLKLLPTTKLALH